ncbi:hypothetical protein H5410_002928 [Solanum commersonii]|uniref:Uncharacterized protein n=1 Tax=Solanum commersonii TaxID=4109 RepID=A0A9J6B3L4_SOLCO|nr:hypothetical protein H5410_002928 [Solanum commersonii]
MGWIMSMIKMLKKRRKVMLEPHFMKVCGLRSKARTLKCKKEQNKLKKGRKASLMIAKSTWRIVELPLAHLILQYTVPGTREIWANYIPYQRIAESINEARLYH